MAKYVHTLRFRAHPQFFWGILLTVLSELQPDTNKYMRQEVTKVGIAFSGARVNRMVHLVVAALEAVAAEAQGLVGQELLGARVDGSADGNTERCC